MFAAVHRLIFSREQSSVTVLGELVCIHIHTISIVEQSLLQNFLGVFHWLPKTFRDRLVPTRIKDPTSFCQQR